MDVGATGNLTFTRQVALSAHYFRSPLVNEETVRLGHWLGLVFCVPFSDLTLILMFDRNNVWPIKACATYSQRFSNGTSE